MICVVTVTQTVQQRHRVARSWNCYYHMKHYYYYYY